jgi:leader peptidase (prepilin peptidase)/N-methyltransferase
MRFALTVIGMSAEWAIFAATLGAVGAGALRRPMFALAVDPGQPNRRRCGSCGRAPMRLVPAWHGRCVHCRTRIGPRWASVELVSALMCAAIVAARGVSVESIGIAAVSVIGVALAVIDLHSFRLPNRLIAAAAAVLSLSLLIESIIGNQWSLLLSAVLGALGLSGTYLVLAVIRPGQLGLGDVKLAALLGMLLGWLGWPFVVLGGCLAFLLSALTILVLLAMRRITMRSYIPFGPFMLAGAAAALLL